MWIGQSDETTFGFMAWTLLFWFILTALMNPVFSHNKELLSLSIGNKCTHCKDVTRELANNWLCVVSSCLCVFVWAQFPNDLRT